MKTLTYRTMERPGRGFKDCILRAHDVPYVITDSYKLTNRDNKIYWIDDIIIYYTLLKLWNLVGYRFVSRGMEKLYGKYTDNLPGGDQTGRLRFLIWTG